MGMQMEALIVLALCGVILLLIAVGSWYRRRKLAKKDNSCISRIQETIVNGQRTFRIATVSRHEGQLSLDIYEIRLPRPNEPPSAASIRLLPSASTTSTNNQPQPPPPPFSTAINMPSPDEECPVPPPPTYEEIIPTSSVSNGKLPADRDDNEISSTTKQTSNSS